MYVPQMEAVADFYETSPFYRGELMFTMEEFKRGLPRGKTLIIGRNGNHHHQDVNHLKMLRDKRIISEGEDLSLVLFDRHDDYGRYRKDLPEQTYGMGDWVSYGIFQQMFANAIIVGAHPSSVSTDMDWLRNETLSPKGVMRWLEEVKLYLSGEGIVYDQFYPEAEAHLNANPCVQEYDVIEGRYVQIKFKGLDQVTYGRAKSRVVVSTDLDILDESEMEVDFFQGGVKTEGLEDLLRTVPEVVEAAIVSGFTEQSVKRTRPALRNMSRILAAHSELLERSN